MRDGPNVLLNTRTGVTRRLLCFSYLFVFFHGGIELLGKVVGDIGHAWLLLIGSAQAGLVLTRLLVVLLLIRVFAVAFCVLQKNDRRRQRPMEHLSSRWRPLVALPQRPYIDALVGSTVLLPFPLLLLLFQLFDALLQHIGPEIALKVRQLFGTGQAILRRLLEDILKG